MKKQISRHIILYTGKESTDYHKLSDKNNNSMHLRNLHDLHHKHDDYQLILINRKRGQCIVCDSIEEYCYGDILLIGRNVPHCYLIEQKIIAKSEETNNDEIMHFRPDIFPANMEEIFEYKHIYSLLKMSQRGIIFHDMPLFKKIRKMPAEIDYLSGIAKINALMLLLELLGRSKHKKLISMDTSNADNNQNYNSDPLQRTFDYIYSHFKEDVTLSSIANYARLTPTALCRLFKCKTGTTIFSFLNKIRINNACKLLTHPELTISYIAFESGYNSLSHFNREFQKIIHQSPRNYRIHYNG